MEIIVSCSPVILYPCIQERCSWNVLYELSFTVLHYYYINEGSWYCQAGGFSFVRVSHVRTSVYFIHLVDNTVFDHKLNKNVNYRTKPTVVVCRMKTGRAEYCLPSFKFNANTVAEFLYHYQNYTFLIPYFEGNNKHVFLRLRTNSLTNYISELIYWILLFHSVSVHLLNLSV